MKLASPFVLPGLGLLLLAPCAAAGTRSASVPVADTANFPIVVLGIFGVALVLTALLTAVYVKVTSDDREPERGVSNEEAGEELRRS